MEIIYVENPLLTIRLEDRMIPQYQLCFGAPYKLTYTKHMSLRECTMSVFTIIIRCPTCVGLRYSVIYVTCNKLTSCSHFGHF